MERCCICFEKTPLVSLSPCSHMVCSSCSFKIVDCPICRAKLQVLVIFEWPNRKRLECNLLASDTVLAMRAVLAKAFDMPVKNVKIHALDHKWEDKYSFGGFSDHFTVRDCKLVNGTILHVSMRIFGD